MKHFYQKPQNTHGQNTTEFSLVLFVVMAGIIIMAPYVIRSWNANLKGWEDSTIDSFNEPLVEAPPDGISLPFCDCEPFDDVACRASINTPLGTISCGPREMLQSRKCRPQDCEWSVDPPPTTAQCVLDESCCTDPLPTGNCGKNASQPLTGAGTCPATFVLDDTNSFCTCPDGMMESSQLCGANPNPQFICVADPACQFSCTGVPTESVRNTGLCPGDDTGLLADTTALASFACSAPNGSPPKCQFVCKFPFVPRPDGSDCECPNIPPAIETPPGSGIFEVIVCKNTPNINLATILGTPSQPVTVTVRIDPGVTVYSTTPSAPSFTTGALPAGTNVTIVNNGRIQGAGGKGGNGGHGKYGPFPGLSGGNGGTALVLTLNIAFNNTAGQIWGGGGGGGGGNASSCGECYDDHGGGGGGGAGFTSGGPGCIRGVSCGGYFTGNRGSQTAGGAGWNGCYPGSRECHASCPTGGNGGGPGQPGTGAPCGGGGGGARGAAILNNGHTITWTGTGDIRGPQL